MQKQWELYLESSGVRNKLISKWCLLSNSGVFLSPPWLCATIINIQIKKDMIWASSWSFNERKTLLAPLGSGFQDGSPIRPHVFTQMSPCVSGGGAPTSLAPKNNSCIFYSRKRDDGASIWSKYRGAGLFLSSMMYAAPWYLPLQSPDCFDIFISMSSIINHPPGVTGGGGEEILSLCAASDYRWKTKLSDSSAKCLILRLTFPPSFLSKPLHRFIFNIRMQRNTIYVIQYSLALCVIYTWDI